MQLTEAQEKRVERLLTEAFLQGAAAVMGHHDKKVYDFRDFRHLFKLDLFGKLNQE